METRSRSFGQPLIHGLTVFPGYTPHGDFVEAGAARGSPRDGSRRARISCQALLLVLLIQLRPLGKGKVVDMSKPDSFHNHFRSLLEKIHVEVCLE